MREVLPELLDSLPHDDLQAVRSREELRLINTLMGNHRWIIRTIARRALAGERILELGAGDGTLSHRLWKEGIVSPGRYSALDLAPAHADWPRDATWIQGDLFTLPSLPEAEIVVANLFLHHFVDNQLKELGKRLPASCRLFIACEPTRHWVHSLQGRLLSAIAGLSHVTHHDMLVSIRAGFVRDELPRALGLSGWQTVVSNSALGAYRLLAWR